MLIMFWLSSPCGAIYKEGTCQEREVIADFGGIEHCLKQGYQAAASNPWEQKEDGGCGMTPAEYFG